MSFRLSSTPTGKKVGTIMYNTMGPLQPMAVMKTTGRTYTIVVPRQGQRPVRVDEWMPDAQAQQKDIRVWGKNATMEVRRGQC